MKIFPGSTHHKISAGIAINNDSLQYIELDESREIIRDFTVNLSRGVVINNSVKDFTQLASAFTKLAEMTGNITHSVTIGIPSGDVILRLITFPEMTLDDIKSSIALNFEENFPFSGPEAVFDSLVVEIPPQAQSNKSVTVLTAASRRTYIENLIDIATRSGFHSISIEPANFAMLRAIPEISEELCIFADSHNIVTTWNGHGIFFRTADNRENFADIRNTMQFIENQYKRVRIKKLIFAGLDFNIDSGPDLSVVNISDKFYQAEGLAMRNPENNYVLDMRPVEYIALEKRRNSLNLNRVILLALLAGFLIMSAGTIIFSFTRINFLQNEVDFHRITIDELNAQKFILMRENAELTRKRNQTEKILQFLHNDIPALEILNAIESNAGVGIKLSEANFTSSESGFTVNLRGTTTDEKSLISMSEGLQQSGIFESVITPDTSRNKEDTIYFTMVLLVKGDFYVVK